MKNLSIIVAVASDGAIGRGGDLVFHISADLRRFKALTMGHPIIMGRKTFESLPKGALPGRRNIVVSRREDYQAPGAEVAKSVDEAMALVDGYEGEVFVIGGASVYAEAMPLASTIHLTRILAPARDADTFFPEIDNKVWCETEAGPVEHDGRAGVDYRFVTLAKSVSEVN